MPIERRPDRIATRIWTDLHFAEFFDLVGRDQSHTVCREAFCPSIYEGDGAMSTMVRTPQPGWLPVLVSGQPHGIPMNHDATHQRRSSLTDRTPCGNVGMSRIAASDGAACHDHTGRFAPVLIHGSITRLSTTTASRGSITLGHAQHRHSPRLARHHANRHSLPVHGHDRTSLQCELLRPTRTAPTPPPPGCNWASVAAKNT